MLCRNFRQQNKLQSIKYKAQRGGKCVYVKNKYQYKSSYIYLVFIVIYKIE